MSIQEWNMAAICKILWNFSEEEDRLWQWVHMYYGKDGTVWNIQATQASWMVKKTLQAHKYLEGAGWPEATVTQMEKFSIKQVCQLLRGEYQKVTWRKLQCDNIACPKWIFILYLTLHVRLLTKERLLSWANVGNIMCVLCDDGIENIEHLFFSCPYSGQVWKKVLRWQTIQKQASG